MLNNISIFPTLVTVVKNIITKEQAADIRAYLLTRCSLKSHGLIEGKGYSSYDENSDFLGEICRNVKGCEKIKETINKLLLEYSDTSGFVHRVIDRSWANIQLSNSNLKPHTHPCSVITGALYVSANNPSPLTLHNPNSFISYTAYEKITEFTRDIYSIIPEMGMVVLFPSWLLHSSETSKDEERIVISFNSGLR